MRILYIVIFICSWVGSYGQQILLSDGNQKIQLFENGTYHLLTETDTVIVHLIQPDKNDSVNYYVLYSKIIEAEYFIANYLLHKEFDVTNLSLKVAKEENHIKDISKCKEKLKELRIKIKDNEDLYNNALHYKSVADHIIQDDTIANDKKWKKLKRYVDSKDYLLKLIQNRALNPSSGPEENKESERTTEVTTLENIKTNKIEAGTNCSITEEINTGKVELSLPFTPFFTYTPDRLKSHLKNENLLSGLVRFKQINNQYYIDLNLVLKSKDAAKSYGVIPENNLFRVEFVNGIRLNFKNLKNSGGSIEEYSGKVIYKLTFVVEKDMLNLIEKVPVDHVGLMWSSGFEKYNIYEIDALMNQYKCLKSVNNKK